MTAAPTASGLFTGEWWNGYRPLYSCAFSLNTLNSMEHTASPLVPRRNRSAVLVILAVLGLAGAAFMVRRPLMMVVPMCTAGQWELCFGTFNGVALVTVAALPLAVVAAWCLARRRGAAGVRSAWRMSLAEAGIVYGTLPWVWITMLPGAWAGVVAGRVSLVPLQDLVTMDGFSPAVPP